MNQKRRCLTLNSIIYFNGPTVYRKSVNVFLNANTAFIVTQNPHACNEDCTGLRLSHGGSKTVIFIIRVAPPGGYDGPHLQERDYQ